MRTVIAGCFLAASLLAPCTSDAQAGSADTAPILVEGVVPDEATKAAVLAKVREIYGVERVVDQVRLGGVVAPPNWGENVA